MGADSPAPVLIWVPIWVESEIFMQSTLIDCAVKPLALNPFFKEFAVLKIIFLTLAALSADAHVCPKLEGPFACGIGNGPRDSKVTATTVGNVFVFGDGRGGDFQILADGINRDGNFGGPGKDANYTATCLNGRLEIEFRTQSKGKFLWAKDKFYVERGGMVQIREYHIKSEVTGPPRVLRCGPMIEPRAGAAAPIPPVRPRTAPPADRSFGDQVIDFFDF